MTRLALTIALLLLCAPTQAQTCSDVLPSVDSIATAHIDSLQSGRVLECVHVPSKQRWTLQYAGGMWLVDCPFPQMGSLSMRMEEAPGCIKEYVTTYSKRDSL